MMLNVGQHVLVICDSYAGATLQDGHATPWLSTPAGTMQPMTCFARHAKAHQTGLQARETHQNCMRKAAEAGQLRDMQIYSGSWRHSNERLCWEPSTC